MPWAQHHGWHMWEPLGHAVSSLGRAVPGLLFPSGQGLLCPWGPGRVVTTQHSPGPIDSKVAKSAGPRPLCPQPDTHRPGQLSLATLEVQLGASMSWASPHSQCPHPRQPGAVLLVSLAWVGSRQGQQPVPRVPRQTPGPQPGRAECRVTEKQEGRPGRRLGVPRAGNVGRHRASAPPNA